MPIHFNYLPNRILPKENESLPSYLIRLSTENGVKNPFHLIPKIFKNFKNPQFVMDIRGPWTEGELFESPMKKLGLGLDIKDLLNCTFYHLYNNINQSYKKFSYLTNLEKNNYCIEKSFLDYENINICPLCLSEFGFINKYWSVKEKSMIGDKLLQCPIHNIDLINRCPKCNTKISYKNSINSMKSCKFCDFKFSDYYSKTNYDSGWENKGNYLVIKIIDSEGTILPYISEEKIIYYYQPWKEKIDPFQLNLWLCFYKLSGMQSDYIDYYNNQLKYKTPFEICLNMIVQASGYNFDYDFGYNAFHGTLSNKFFFQSYPGLISFSNVIMESTHIIADLK